MFLTLESESEAGSVNTEETFYCATIEDTQSDNFSLRVICDDQGNAAMGKLNALGLLDDMELIYNQSFLCDALFSIVRNMERGYVHIAMANDNPMIITYPLGSDNTSSLRAVLTPLISHESQI